MADICCQYTYVGIKLNDTTAGANRLVLDDDGVSGLDGAPVRSQVDPKGLTSGGLVHPKLLGVRIILFKGFVHIQTTDPSQTTAYNTAMNVLEAAVIAALEGALNSASNLTWTPTGGSGKSISCTYGVPGQ